MMALATAALIAAAWLSARRLGSPGTERWILGYLFLHAQIVAIGYGLSALGTLGDPAAWLAGAVLALAVAAGATGLGQSAHPAGRVAPGPSSWRTGIIVAGLGITVVGLGAINLAQVLLTAPHNWDSLTGHLPRTVYFLQQGHLGWYDANYWAQVTHPRNHPILLAFAFLTGGERATQVVQYLAWLALAFSVYAIALRLGARRVYALVAALVALLPVIVILESTTTQNDLLAASYVGAGVYLLMAYRASRRATYLVLGTLPLVLMVGLKASTILIMPSIAVIALLCIRTRRGWATAFGVLVVSAVLVSQTGYTETWRRIGHPVADATTRVRHSFTGLDAGEMAGEWAKNLLRHASDFATLDGFGDGAAVRAAEKVLKAPVLALAALAGTDLAESARLRRSFRVEREYRRHEDFSQIGVAGMLLFAPIWLAALLRGRRAPVAFTFALASLVFLLVQCAVPYNPWSGRYVTWTVPFAAPLVAWALPGLMAPTAGRIYILAAVALICASAVLAVLFRTNSAVIVPEGHWSPGVFDMDRIQELTRNNPPMAPVIRRFDELVGIDKTVGLSFTGVRYEYLFFGEGAARRVVPRPGEPVFETVDVLVHDGLPPMEGTTDTPLGEDRGETLFLRRPALSSGGG